MNKTIWIILVLFLLFPASTSLAEESGSPFSLSLSPADVFQSGGSGRVEVETVADLQVTDFTLVAQDKNKLRLTFQLKNKLSAQSNLVYELELTRKINQTRLSLDKQVFENEKLTIRENEQITKEANYQAPEYFNGPGELLLRIKDPSGLTLALSSLAVNFSGSGEYLELASPCYLTVGDADQKYGLSQGVDLKPEERLFLNCQAENKANRQLDLVPVFSASRRGVSNSDDLSETALQAITSFASGERRMLKLDLPKPKEPQAYDLSVYFEEGGGEIRSNKVIAHIVISGKSATIINASLDKDQYAKGEKAVLAVLLSRSADGFPGSRHRGTRLEEPNLQIEIKDNKGELCGIIAKQPIGDFIHSNKIEVPIEQKCLNPQVALYLKDGAEVLDSRFMNVSSQKKPAGRNWNLQVIFITLSGLLLLIVLIWQRRRKMIANKIWPDSKKTFLLLFFLLGSFVFASEASAATYTLSDYSFYRETVDTPYLLGYGVDPVDLPDCAQATQDYLQEEGWKPSATPVSYGGVSFSYLYHDSFPNEYYFCGVMQANFTVGLNKDSFNKLDPSDDIILTGEAQGLKTCTNGINSAIIEKTPCTDSTKCSVGSDLDLSNYKWLLGESAPVRMTDSMTEPATFSKTYDSSLFNVANYQTVKFYYGYEHAGKWKVVPMFVTESFDVVSEPVQCDFTATLSATPASGSAPLGVNLALDIETEFGGFTYGSFSCGSGGSISNTDTSDGSFTCTYSTAGTYIPSLKVTQWDDGYHCSLTPSVIVTVGGSGTPEIKCSIEPNPIETGEESTICWTATNVNKLMAYCSSSFATPYPEVEIPEEKYDDCGSSIKYDVAGTKTCYFKGYDSNDKLLDSCETTLTVTEAGASINGVCGTANNKVYTAAETGWGSDTFCSAGTAEPTSPTFPAPSGSTSWKCKGSGEGTDASCAATRDSGGSGTPACATEGCYSVETNKLNVDSIVCRFAKGQKDWNGYAFCSSGTPHREIAGNSVPFSGSNNSFTGFPYSPMPNSSGAGSLDDEMIYLWRCVADNGDHQECFGVRFCQSGSCGFSLGIEKRSEELENGKYIVEYGPNGEYPFGYMDAFEDFFCGGEGLQVSVSTVTGIFTCEYPVAGIYSPMLTLYQSYNDEDDCCMQTATGNFQIGGSGSNMEEPSNPANREMSSCQPDDYSNCASRTCKDLYCFDGCNYLKGLKDCVGRR